MSAISSLIASAQPVAAVIISVALMLFSGFAMTRLTKLLRLPNVTAYILAGILIGPYCLNLVPQRIIDGMDFDSVLPGVQAGKFDVGVSGISVTEKRQKNVLFTDPYCLAAQAIVVTEGSSITCKADLEGKKVSVQTGTTAESFCMDNGYDVSSFAANSDAQTALTSGKVDAWVIDDLTAADMVKVYNAAGGDQLVILDEAMTTEPYAFAFAFGSEDLVAEINTILNGLVADGTIASIFEKYDAPYTSPANS